MKKLIFICEVCGHKLEKFGNINDLDEIIACPLCLSAMDLVDIEEKNKWKKRMLSTVSGIDFPKDFDNLSEEEKEKRLNGAIKISQEKIKEER